MYSRSRRGKRSTATSIATPKAAASKLVVAAIAALITLTTACAELERPPSYSGSPDSSLVLGERSGGGRKR